jgi:hypothetical protein
MVEVVEQGSVAGAQGWDGERRGDLGAIYRELEAVRGGNISPVVGLAGGGSGWGLAGFPVAGEGTARAGRRDGSGKGVGRPWWQRSSTRGIRRLAAAPVVLMVMERAGGVNGGRQCAVSSSR